MGGRINITSKLGEGTVVTVEFPTTPDLRSEA